MEYLLHTVLRLTLIALLSSLPLIPSPAAPSSTSSKAASATAAQVLASTAHTVPYPVRTANGATRSAIDAHLLQFAAQRFLSGRSRTGVAYNVTLPPLSHLHGITCQVMRLRAGSLRRRGLSFNNFRIPTGVVVHTGGPFVLIVYKSIPLSLPSLLYSLPPGYTLISPILGLLVFTALAPTSFNGSSPQMNLVFPSDKPPMSVTIPIQNPYNLSSLSQRSAPLCAFFDINGDLSFSNLSFFPNTCSLSTLMDVALVQLLSNSSSNSTNGPQQPTSKQSKGSPARAWRVALIAVVASFCGFAVMGATVMMGIRVQDKCQVAKMVKEPGDHQETLHTSVIGHTRAPTAAGIRTKPTLETESLKT